jgi:Condensation domain
LDTAALRAALRDVAGRHESLRTLFLQHDGEPWQRVLPLADVDLPFTVRDCAAGAVEGHVADVGRRPFDLEHEPPLAVTVLRTAPTEHTVVLLLHHLATDEWSDGPLLRDLGAAYAARRQGRVPVWAPLPVQCADHALWQRELLGDGTDPDARGLRLRRWWREALDGAPDRLELPADRHRHDHFDDAGRLHVHRLPGALRDRIHGLAAQTRTSPFMVTQAAVATLLHRMGAGEDLPLGVPSAGRDEPDLEDLVGFFVNTIVLRTDLSGDPSFDELLARVRAADLAAFEHQDLPFGDLVEAIAPARDRGRTPLVDVMVAYHKRPPEHERPLGLDGDVHVAHTGAAKFDLDLMLVEDPGGLVLHVEYRSALFDAETIAELAARFERLLEQVLADPARRLSSIDVLLDGERERLLGLRQPPPRAPGTLVTMLDTQRDLAPDATAVVVDHAART